MLGVDGFVAEADADIGFVVARDCVVEQDEQAARAGLAVPINGPAAVAAFVGHEQVSEAVVAIGLRDIGPEPLHIVVADALGGGGQPIGLARERFNFYTAEHSVAVAGAADATLREGFMFERFEQEHAKSAAA